MRSAKAWLLGTFAVSALAGSAALLGTSSKGLAQPPLTPGQERRAERSYWRHHDGRWNYWDGRDQRWYYTDGSHWYYRNGNAWQIYRFDKTFGRDNFERAKYAVPGPGVDVVLPRHEVYVAPR